MTSSKTDPYLVHFLGSTTVVVSAGSSGTRSVEYGQELLVTDAIRALNTDQNRKCWLDYADDEGEQLARYHRVLVRKGPWPTGISRYPVGSFEWEDAREAARQAAHRIEEPEQRQKALAKVREDFGPKLTSRTMATYQR